MLSFNTYSRMRNCYTGRLFSPLSRNATNVNSPLPAPRYLFSVLFLKLLQTVIGLLLRGGCSSCRHGRLVARFRLFFRAPRRSESGVFGENTFLVFGSRAPWRLREKRMVCFLKTAC